MDPSLVVLIIFASLITLVGMPWVIFWGIARLRAQQAGTGTPLRRSDLEAIVAAAVEDANAPVLRRLDVLEAIAAEEAPAQGRIDPAVLSDALDRDPLEDVDDRTAAARRRARG